METKVSNYRKELERCFDELQPSRLETIITYLRRAETIYIIGNGGSASTASHMAIDLSKAGLRAISLTDISAMTAWSNDVDYSSALEEQLKRLLKREDALIAISVSGRSPNIIKAVKYANDIGAITIGFSGFGNNSHLSWIVDLDVTVSSENYGVVEDFSLSLNHILSQQIARIK